MAKTTSKKSAPRKSKTSAKPKAKTRKKPVKKRGVIARIWRWIWRGVFGVFAFCVLLVILFRFVNPPNGIYILEERHRLGAIKQEWIAIEDFARHMPLSVVAAEDANFCLHSGFDLDAIKGAWEDGGNRGGSTITQQVAKNVFLWHDRSWLRKGLEAGFTVLIEIIWPKERIVEVYLNVAEFDAGVFGAGAAAKHYFGASPKNISALQAARLASVLPNPQQRSASRPSQSTRNKTRRVMSGARTIAADGRDKCF